MRLGAIRLVCEEIEYITQHAAPGFIDFRILALGARHGTEALALDVEDFGQKATRCPKLTDFIPGVATFRAFEIQIFLCLIHPFHPHFSFLTMEIRHCCSFGLQGSLQHGVCSRSRDKIGCGQGDEYARQSP